MARDERGSRAAGAAVRRRPDDRPRVWLPSERTMPAATAAARPLEDPPAYAPDCGCESCRRRPAPRSQSAMITAPAARSIATTLASRAGMRRVGTVPFRWHVSGVRRCPSRRPAHHTAPGRPSPPPLVGRPRLSSACSDRETPTPAPRVNLADPRHRANHSELMRPSRDQPRPPPRQHDLRLIFNIGGANAALPKPPPFDRTAHSRPTTPLRARASPAQSFRRGRQGGARRQARDDRRKGGKAPLRG